MDEFETVFMGGKKKKSSGNARLMKPLKDFKKAKYITEVDRVAVIMNTYKPYDANVKEAKTYFDKKFYFPFPNYATRKLILQELIA